MKLITRIEFEVKSEEEYQRMKESNKLPNEKWSLHIK